MAFNRERIARVAAALEQKGVFIGTSSWKYPGWRGLLYDESRYVYRGSFSEARFNDFCLTEYAEVFKTVCVDAAYYRFPDAQSLRELVSQVPRDFLFVFKVTDEITIKTFPNLRRFGARAGKANENFLNPELMAKAFLAPCEAIKNNVGLLIFEFSRFHQNDFAHGREFVGALEQFLARLPRGWPYGVEVRNKTFLHTEYFDALREHGASHILTHPDFFGVRFLLAPGRRYQEAVSLFSPYDCVKEVNEEGRATGAKLIKQVVSSAGRSKGFIYVNNRFEGSAPETVGAMLDLAGGE
jgi:uncharacterized protein YecE (DUF72 family)